MFTLKITGIAGPPRAEDSAIQPAARSVMEAIGKDKLGFLQSQAGWP